MSNDLPHSVWQGSFFIGGIEIKCHVLSDGQRIIEAESMDKFFLGEFDHEPTEAEIIDFAKWQKGKDAP